MINLMFSCLLIAVIFVSICITVMVILFSLANKDAGKDIVKGILVLALAVSVPFSAYLVIRQTRPDSKAETAISVVHAEVVSIDNRQALINIVLNRPAVLYLKYTDSVKKIPVPVLPTSSPSSRTEHSFIITPATSRGGSATLVIDNQDYLPGKYSLTIKP